MHLGSYQCPENSEYHPLYIVVFSKIRLLLGEECVPKYNVVRLLIWQLRTHPSHFLIFLSYQIHLLLLGRGLRLPLLCFSAALSVALRV